MGYTLYIFIFVLGAIAGSFLNVCIYRMAKGDSVIWPRSHCPHCRKDIPWYDNIPIISFIVLKGRCRSCNGKIRFRYILVEILTASMALLLFSTCGLGPKFYAYSVFVCALIVATFIDFEIQEIPDEISLGGLAAGLILAFIFPSLMNSHSHTRALIGSLIGAFAGGASIYIMGVIGTIIFKKDAMGGGDVKLMAMIGAFLGLKMAAVAFFIAPVFGALAGMALKMRDGREIIAYGPYLSLGAIVALLYGDKILGLFFYGLI